GPSLARLHWISVTGSANEKFADQPLLLCTNETIGGSGVWSGAAIAGAEGVLSLAATCAKATPPSSDKITRLTLRREIDMMVRPAESILDIRRADWAAGSKTGKRQRPER